MKICSYKNQREKSVFRAEQYITLPWLEYDQEKDEASCFACKNFLRGSNFRFSTWEDLRRLKKQKSISHEQKTKEIDENRTYLKTIMESLTFVAKQNIAMRSNNDDCTDIGSSSDTNRGNFF